MREIFSIDVLEMFAGHFFENGKKDLIEKLLMTIDLEKYDAQKLETFCQNNKLEISQIFTCTKININFLAPIELLLKIYQDYEEAKNNLKSEQGLKCLWYLD